MFDETIASERWYDENTQAYVSWTLNVDLQHLYEPFLAHIPSGGRILDAGCGSGRDSFAFQSMGYDVTAADASVKMVGHATRLLGRPAMLIRHQDVDFREEFDGVWSMASLLHVARHELPGVLEIYRRALVPGGVLFASFKHGEGEVTRDERLFTNQNEVSFERLIAAVPGFDLLQTSIDRDTRPGRLNDVWFSVICRRTDKSGSATIDGPIIRNR